MARAAETDTSLDAELRARGYRVTPQRQLVLDAVEALGHATPEEVCDLVQLTATAVNISTVYRTLDLLEELGLVQHAHLGHGAPTYSLPTAHDHIHLVCRGCGQIDETPSTLLRGITNQLAKKHGFELDIGHVALFGRCSACQASDE